MSPAVVDTSVWSLFLRRRSSPGNPRVEMLKSLVQDGRAQMLGTVRQELLSGIKVRKQFEAIEELFSDFPDLLATSDDHTTAAKFYNRCRSKGVQGSAIDFLICAQAFNANLEILAEDEDFARYARHVPVKLIRA